MQNTTEIINKLKNMRTIYSKTFMTVMAILATTTTAMAQIPQGYYATLKGKKGAELKTAVHEIIKTASVLSYGSGAGRTWDGFYSTDQAEDGMVIDRYSYDKRYFGEKGASVSGMNIEHSFPKSWWGGSENQAYRDLYNLMPCEQKINSSKSNYPMGIVTTVKTDNGCTKIGTGNNGYSLWEPADEWKGDFARGYMYMATAYQNLTWSGTQALQILQQGDWPTLQKWAYTLYIDWAKTDAVDAGEVKRNNAVCKIQGNRNPFVDFPNLMEYIWGDSIDYAFDPETTVCSETYVGGGDDPQPEPDGDVLYDGLFTAGNGACVVYNTTVPYDGFTVWQTDSKYGWKGSGYSGGTYYDVESTLLTPEINLEGYAKAVLWFEHAVNFCSDPAGTMSVEIVCDGQSKALTGFAWPSGYNWTFVESGDIDISEYAGKRMQVGFRYRSTSSEAGTWEIKRMTVTGFADKAGISSTYAPATGPDFSKPYEAFTTDGRRVDIAHKGLLIIRQNGRVWKIKR